MIRVALSQIQTVTGDLKGNTARILNGIQQASNQGADIVVLPEVAITGYCCGALFENEEFIRENVRILNEEILPTVPEELVVVIGFVDLRGTKKRGYLDIRNSAAVIQGGKLLSVYDKILLAGLNHHEDRKYFTPGINASVTEIELRGEKIRIGTPICEDVWAHQHERDIISEMKDRGADLILCINQSYFYYGKQLARQELYEAHGREKGLPVVSVNAVGVGDIVKNIMIFDGGSLAVNSDGKPLLELKRFKEDFGVVEIDLQASVSREISWSKEEKYAELFQALCFEQRELFSALGIQKAQVHLSGGVDSALVAAITVSAMGVENTICISNPTSDNSDETRDLATHVAKVLGVKLYWNDTGDPYEAVLKSFEEGFDCEPTPAGRASMQAVLRTVQGISASHTFKSGIVATGNHTEIVLGWASFHDIGSVGVHAPIGDLTKVEVYQLAAYVNKHFGREVIPETLYDGTLKPRAELADADEDPFDYFVMSGICAEMIRNRKGVDTILQAYKDKSLTPDFFPETPDGKSVYAHCSFEEFEAQVREAERRSRFSVYKSAQAAPNVIISPRSRGFSTRETIINRYTG